VEDTSLRMSLFFVMLNALTVTGIICLAAWLWLTLGQGLFWRVRGKPPARSRSNSVPKIAAVIPARNEADVIASVLRSLCAQKNIEMQIYVVNDASTDGTAEVVRKSAARGESEVAITLIEGKALVPGWTGKLWAMEQGIQRAKEGQHEWLLLADADVEQGPDSIATLAAIAEAGHYDLASYMVRLHCESPAEKMLIPAFVYFFFKLYPPAWVRNPLAVTAGAAGGCILVRTSALERAGGISTIRGALIDDCSLAALVKKSGGRIWLGLGDESYSLRRYPQFADIEQMVARTAFYQLHHSFWLLLGTILGMTLLYLAPPMLVASGRFVPMMLGGVAWALMSFTYCDLVGYYKLPSWRALTLPAAALFYLGATVHSAIKYWSGTGGEWKGRSQDAGRANDH